MDNKHEILAAEMAAVNTAKSTELFDALRGPVNLNEAQIALDNSADRVLEVQKLLSTVEAYEVTPALVETVDQRLERSGVEIPLEDGFSEVQGAEALGLTLLPKNFLLTRMMGCENFLTDFFKSSRDVVMGISSSFRDAWILFTQNEEGLRKALDLLETQVNSYPDFISTNSFILEHRLYNLFKVNGKVNEDWAGNIAKLNSSIQALSGGYYLNSKQTLQATMSYFGGFSKLTQLQADERIQALPLSIPSIPFKECSYPSKEFTNNLVIGKQSVELMGGAFFYDARLRNKPVQASGLEMAGEYVALHIENDITGFSNNAARTFEGVGSEIKALSSREIKAIIKQLRTLLDGWGAMFEKGEKFKMADADYNDVIKGLIESDIDDTVKVYLGKWFGSLVRKNQMELLVIRVEVANYLTLIINGLISICNNSIRVNAG